MNLHEIIGRLYSALLETQARNDKLVEENNALKMQILSLTSGTGFEAKVDDGAGTG